MRRVYLYPEGVSKWMANDIRSGDTPTVGDFKRWLEENEVEDDALILCSISIGGNSYCTTTCTVTDWWID